MSLHIESPSLANRSLIDALLPEAFSGRSAHILGAWVGEQADGAHLVGAAMLEALPRQSGTAVLRAEIETESGPNRTEARRLLANAVVSLASVCGAARVQLGAPANAEGPDAIRKQILGFQPTNQFQQCTISASVLSQAIESEDDLPAAMNVVELEKQQGEELVELVRNEAWIDEKALNRVLPLFRRAMNAKSNRRPIALMAEDKPIAILFGIPIRSRESLVLIINLHVQDPPSAAQILRAAFKASSPQPDKQLVISRSASQHENPLWPVACGAGADVSEPQAIWIKSIQ